MVGSLGRFGVIGEMSLQGVSAARGAAHAARRVRDRWPRRSMRVERLRGRRDLEALDFDSPRHRVGSDGGPRRVSCRRGRIARCRDLLGGSAVDVSTRRRRARWERRRASSAGRPPTRRRSSRCAAAPAAAPLPRRWCRRPLAAPGSCAWAAVAAGRRRMPSATCRPRSRLDAGVVLRGVRVRTVASGDGAAATASDERVARVRRARSTVLDPSPGRLPMQHSIPVDSPGPARRGAWRAAVSTCVHCGFCLPACPTYRCSARRWTRRAAASC